MSRTWRSIPKASTKSQTRHHNTGGAVASKGPSPERRRPDAEHETQNLIQAAEILQVTAARIDKTGQSRAPQGALRQSASDVGIPAGRAPPVIQIALTALSQTGDDSRKPSPETYRTAS